LYNISPDKYLVAITYDRSILGGKAANIRFYRSKNEKKPTAKNLLKAGSLIVYNVNLEVLKEITAFKEKSILLPKM